MSAILNSNPLSFEMNDFATVEFVGADGSITTYSTWGPGVRFSGPLSYIDGIKADGTKVRFEFHDIIQFMHSTLITVRGPLPKVITLTAKDGGTQAAAYPTETSSYQEVNSSLFNNNPLNINVVQCGSLVLTNVNGKESSYAAWGPGAALTGAQCKLTCVQADGSRSSLTFRNTVSFTNSTIVTIAGSPKSAIIFSSSNGESNGAYPV